MATRETLLKGYTAGLERFHLPDPLAALATLLDENVIASRATIHGDLNLENVLVGPGDFVWLIDFAETRDGHTLADFAHLEAEIISHVIAPQMPSPQAFVGLLQDDQLQNGHNNLQALRASLHQIAARCSVDPAQPREYHLALYMACLGALKYRNLGAHQKQLLYLTAAYLTTQL
jgi:hypothetical protein